MKIQDFTCEYSKHACELKTDKKMALATRRQKFSMRFKDMFLLSEKNFRSEWYLRSKGAIQLEILKQKNSKHWYIVHPFSQLRLFWELFMIPIFFMSLGYVPIRCGFLNAFFAKFYIYHNRPTTQIYFVSIVDYYLNLVWLIDKLGNFITGYYNKATGHVIMDPKTIYSHYLAPGFILDAAACVPADFYIIQYWGMDGYANMSRTAFCILFMYNLYSCVKFRSYLIYCYRFKKFGSFPLAIFRLAASVLTFFFIINWAMCFALVFPQIVVGDALYINPTRNLTWYLDPKFYEGALTDQYLFVFLKALHVNFDTSPYAKNKSTIEDYLLAGFVCIGVRVYWLFFLVSFLESLTAMQVLKNKFYLIREQLKTYMKQKAFPAALKKRLNRLYLYRFQAHYFRDRAIQARLTESLRREIGMYTCERLINHTELFESVPRKEVARLVRKMNRELYFPKDVIIRGNTFGDCMYFICSGRVAVWTVNGKLLRHLEDGEFFGEIALIAQDRRRPTTVTAVTVTEVYMLEALDFNKIIEMYPEVYEKLVKIAAERYRLVVTSEKQG